MDIAETCLLIEYKDEHKNVHHEGGQGGNDSGEEEDDARGRGGQPV